jgi:hypothetical protein
VDANEKIDYLMAHMRELEARIDKLEARQIRAFGTGEPQPKMVVKDGKVVIAEKH